MSGGGFIQQDLPREAGGNTSRQATPSVSLSTHPDRSLTAAQERRLIDYLDEQFLEINRGYKKRFQPNATLPTLSSYLTAVHAVLSMILLVPPVDPSSALRVSYLLRLTGELIDSITGYGVPASVAGDTLEQLVESLNDLDQGWHAVLSSERWDPDRRIGVPIVGTLSRPISQTDRIRLRSILMGGKDKIERWLTEVGRVEPGTQVDVASAFYRTLADLGEMGGGPVERAERIGDEGEDEEDLLELPMEDNPELDL